MAKKKSTAAAKSKAEQPPQETASSPIKMSVLAQYMRDLSFENMVMQKGMKGDDLQPSIEAKVSLDAHKRSVENQYEVIQHLTVRATNKEGGEDLFLVELEYGAIYHVEGLPEGQLAPYLLIECPRMVFPFIRRIVSDVTRDGGFPPLNLNAIDYLAIYSQKLAQQKQAQEEAEGAA